MVCFPNAKINIGLNITSKRSDGFHNIETIFYPIGLSDILEFNKSDKYETVLETTGVALNINAKDNICYKAYELISNDFKLPPLDIFLHKIIPSGAGLGGGSSDAAFLIKEINKLFNLQWSTGKLEKTASILGSDCAFFIRNKAVFAYGRGEKFEDISLNLDNYFIYLVKPDVFVSTAEAYAGVKPVQPSISLKELITRPISEWKNTVVNDFELNIFGKLPTLSTIKSRLYEHGAIYASMSGSGSSIYGIFDKKPAFISEFKEHFNWISSLKK